MLRSYHGVHGITADVLRIYHGCATDMPRICYDSVLVPAVILRLYYGYAATVFRICYGCITVTMVTLRSYTHVFACYHVVNITSPVLNS